MVSQLTLFVFIIGSQCCFGVKIESSETVGDLKDSILEKRKIGLKTVNADRLALYRVELPDGKTLGPLAAQVVKDKEELSPSTPLFEIFPTDPPEETISIVVKILDVIRDVKDGTSFALYDELVDSGLIAYKSIFIKIKSRGKFGDADLDRNCIYKKYNFGRDDNLDHVKTFEQMLDSKAGLDLNDGAWAQVNTKDGSCLATHFRCEETNAGRYAGEGEVKHILLVASFDWENLWQCSRAFELKGNLADILFFIPLLSLLQPALTNKTTTIRLNEKTNFPFIMQRVDIRDGKDRLRVHLPHINFVVSKFGLPRLLVEVDTSRSRSWPMVRLLLEGAAIVRFANTFLEAFRRNKNFVLCAVLILPSGCAMRYTLYQEQDNPRVCYKEKEFSLNESIDRIDFVRQLYNLIHMEGEDEYRKDTIKEIGQLGWIPVHRLKSFSSPDMDTDKFTDYEEADRRNRTGDDEHAADYAELEAHGYEAEPRVIVDESGGRWEQFYQMPSHIHTVYRPWDATNKLIAKKTREKSNEVEILKLLNVARPKSDHVILLVDSFQGQSSKWAILPKLESVADFVGFSPKKLESEVVQVCLDLMKGLAYLHKLCIAHRDIKPDNLLLDGDFCLKIIDFDIAIQVKDEDEEVDHRCGTRGWVAPEIEMKRNVMYSPIKADRWACGRVLLWILNKLGKDEMPLRAIARKLNAYTPKRRPSLLECCSPSSRLFSEDDNIWDADKRKPFRSRQASMEVNEEGMMPPNAKKQKLL